MKFPKYFISCDWGTSNFRLRLINTDTLEILRELKTDDGIKKMYNDYKKSLHVSQIDFFSHYLKNQIKIFPEEYQDSIIVIAGMASSNIGLKNLNYADFPFNLNGSNLSWKYLETDNNLNIILISGVKCPTGMMRGEEIQAVGLEEHLLPFEKGILLLPGTHSKHITYENEAFLFLKNYMTGELFDLLSNKSILSNSVLNSLWDETKMKAFKEGVLLGMKEGISSSLFNVRVRDVLEDFEKDDNYYFLSGLLIGDELSYLKEEKCKIILAAPNSIFKMYKIGLELILDNHDQLLFLNQEILEKALIKGQIKILNLYGEYK